MSEVISGSLEDTTHLLPKMHALEAVEETLRLIPEMPDGQIIHTAIFARELEIQAHLVRGACAAELRKRFATRLVGGRGKRDQTGVGMQARMRELADKIGVDLKTLMADVRIHQTFFEPAPETVTRLACESRLPREFFVTALAAPDPQAAIEMAVVKRRDPTYTRRQYRADVRAMKEQAKGRQAGSKTKNSYCLRVSISFEAQQALSELSQTTGKEFGVIVGDALLALRGKSAGDKNEKVVLRQREFGSLPVKIRNKRDAAPDNSLQYLLEYSE